MASNVTHGITTPESFEELKRKVVECKKNKVEPPPDLLYNLASHISRWKATENLHVCLLCRDSTKKITKRGHIVPHSILNVFGGNKKVCDENRGSYMPNSRAAYKFFCDDCEKKFQQGEDYFTSQFFKDFVGRSHTETKIKDICDENGFSWLYYCLISIFWRCLAISSSEDFNKNWKKEYIERLEIMRRYLMINWEKDGGKDETTKEMRDNFSVHLFSPNNNWNELFDEEIANEEYAKYFFTHGLDKYLIDTNYCGTPVSCHWLFLGPLHILVTHPRFSEIDRLYPHTQLHALDMSFDIPAIDKRFYPISEELGGVVFGLTKDFFLDICQQHVNDNCRLVGDVSGGRTLKMPLTELKLIPKDCNFINGKFQLPQYYIEVFERDLQMIQTGQGGVILGVNKGVVKGVKLGHNSKGIFIYLENEIQNPENRGRGFIALGLSVNDNNQIDFMRDILVPTDVKTQVMKEYKSWIEQQLLPDVKELFNQSKTPM